MSQSGLVVHWLGFVGNEVVAQYRIRAGCLIGSDALKADGVHACTDGNTSLLVLAGAIAVTLRATWADPDVGMVITSAIARVGYRAVRSVGQRLLDAVVPVIVEQISNTISLVKGVVDVTEVRARWSHHRHRQGQLGDRVHIYRVEVEDKVGHVAHRPGLVEGEIGLDRVVQVDIRDGVAEAYCHTLFIDPRECWSSR